MSSIKDKINLTKIKQQTKEAFNKKIKTVDANFEKRMAYVNHL